jgi:hypothetical protein
MQSSPDGVLKFTLTENRQGTSQGDFELCKQVNCAGQYGVKWLKTPRYAADGSQCVLAEYYRLNEKQPSAYVALVLINPLSFPASR